jgi:hypothetical protein
MIGIIQQVRHVRAKGLLRRTQIVNAEPVAVRLEDFVRKGRTAERTAVP